MKPIAIYSLHLYEMQLCVHYTISTNHAGDLIPIDFDVTKLMLRLINKIHCTHQYCVK